MLISAASVEADIHANRKVPANRRRINEAPVGGALGAHQTDILCLNHDLSTRVQFLSAPHQGENLAYESAIAEPSRKSDRCRPYDDDHDSSGPTRGPLLRRCRRRPM